MTFYPGITCITSLYTSWDHLQVAGVPFSMFLRHFWFLLLNHLCSFAVSNVAYNYKTIVLLRNVSNG